RKTAGPPESRFSCEAAKPSVAASLETRYPEFPDPDLRRPRTRQRAGQDRRLFECYGRAGSASGRLKNAIRKRRGEWRCVARRDPKRGAEARPPPLAHRPPQRKLLL